MARIRSIHPGQWTAGDFLECSPLARLLALALRNIADDNGAFRWKPKTIKAECLPADNCDIDALLAELVTNGQIVRYELEGKEYGLICDFTQWQRPKKPKYVHPVPDWFRTSTELVENEYDTASEIPPQRKEEGGSNGGGETRACEPEPAKPKSLIGAEAFEITTAILGEMGKHPEDPISVGGPYIVQHWLNGGVSRDAILCGVKTAMVRKKHDPPSTFKYFENAVLRAHADMSRPLPKVEVRQAETITVNHGTSKPRSGGSLIDTINRERALVEAQIADLALPGDALLGLSDGSVRRS